jgi:hypothetical protein
MTTVVVNGSNNDFRFAITDFSNAKTPSTVFVNPGFATAGDPTNNGCVVACSSLYTDGDISGSLLAVGQYAGGQVAIYDLSDPALPKRTALFDTGLGELTGIGALSLYGNNLLVGEANGPTLVLLDISQPQSSAIISSISAGDFADGGITAVAINGPLAAVSGVYAFDVVDYTDPTSPQVLPFIIPPPGPGVPLLEGPFTCDYDGGIAALGDSNGNVVVFDVEPGVGASIIGESSLVLEGITSITVQSGDAIQVVAGNFGSGTVALLTFGGSGTSPPPNTTLTINTSAGDAGGAVAFYGLPNLFASTNNGQGVTWYGTAGWPSTSLVGVAAGANLAPASISTLGIAYFKTPTGGGPIRWPWRLLPGWLLRLLASLFNIKP